VSCLRALAPLLPLLTSCGWHAGLAAPDGAQTIGIEVFETDRGQLQRGLEPEFADALGKAVVDLVGTPLADPADADVVVRGHIVEYRRRQGIRNTDNQLVETGVYVSVSAGLYDRTGAVLVPNRQRHNWSGYATDEVAQVNEAQARRRALRYIADTLVLDLFGIGDRAPDEPEWNRLPSEASPTTTGP